MSEATAASVLSGSGGETTSGSAAPEGQQESTAPAGETQAQTETNVPETVQSGNESWYAGIDNPDLRGFVENKKWNSVEDAINSYINLEKFRGVPEDKLIRLPDDPAEMGDVYNRLGRPESAEDYNIDIEGVNQDKIGWYKDKVHELGLNDAQATNLLKEVIERSSQEEAQKIEQIQAKNQIEMKELEDEWGVRSDLMKTKAIRAAEKLGLSDQHLAALDQSLGSRELMRMLTGLSDEFNESAFKDGGQRSQGMSPEAAGAKRAELMRDPEFMKRYHSKNAHEQRGAAAQLQDLNKIAHGER